MKETEGQRAVTVSRIARTAGVLALAVLLPGCIDLPDESKALLEVFTVVLIVNIFLNLFLIALLLFYFLPFTRPRRTRKKKRKS